MIKRALICGFYIHYSFFVKLKIAINVFKNIILNASVNWKQKTVYCITFFRHPLHWDIIDKNSTSLNIFGNNSENSDYYSGLSRIIVGSTLAHKHCWLSVPTSNQLIYSIFFHIEGPENGAPQTEAPRFKILKIKEGLLAGPGSPRGFADRNQNIPSWTKAQTIQGLLTLDLQKINY